MALCAESLISGRGSLRRVFQRGTRVGDLRRVSVDGLRRDGAKDPEALTALFKKLAQEGGLRFGLDARLNVSLVE